MTAALETLVETTSAAKEKGFLAYEFEARLATGEIEIATGRSATAKAHLDALMKEATAKDFMQIARRASDLLRKE